MYYNRALAVFRLFSVGFLLSKEFSLDYQFAFQFTRIRVRIKTKQLILILLLHRQFYILDGSFNLDGALLTHNGNLYAQNDSISCPCTNFFLQKVRFSSVPGLNSILVMGILFHTVLVHGSH